MEEEKTRAASALLERAQAQVSEPKSKKYLIMLMEKMRWKVVETVTNSAWMLMIKTFEPEPCRLGSHVGLLKRNCRLSVITSRLANKTECET